MKTRKVLLVSVFVFALLLGGVVTLETLAPNPIVANVEFDPDTFDLGAPAWGRDVKEVLVTVWFDPGKYDGGDIDPKTVLVEGVLEPKGGWKHTWVEKIKNVWVFRFNLAGGDLKDLLWQKVTHEMLGGSTIIPLEVTGNFYGKGKKPGEAFAGTGDVYVVIPTTPPPNPPPS